MIKASKQQCNQLAYDWASKTLNTSHLTFEPLTNDASFRRYYRVNGYHRPLVLMDAPPQHENMQQYIDMAKLLKGSDLCVPEIVAFNLEQGWLLQTDFGNTLLLDKLNPRNEVELYTQALAQLLAVPLTTPPTDLPHYTEQRLLDELALFAYWYCEIHLNQPLTSAEKKAFSKNCDTLVNQARSQPQILVHRDYHSRNLMPQTDSERLGIIDFQDAVIGPFMYDAASLLRDAYYSPSEPMIYSLLDQFCMMAAELRIIKRRQLFQITEWFDLTALQRQLKILGIFARLHHRDHKSAYLNSMPTVLKNTQLICEKYSEFTPILDILRKRQVI